MSGWHDLPVAAPEALARIRWAVIADAAEFRNGEVYEVPMPGVPAAATKLTVGS